MQNPKNTKRNPNEIHRNLIEAIIHLSFCAEVFPMQIDEGRYYLHEHPLTAKSSQEPCYNEIIKHDYNIATIIHMCAYKMKIPDKFGNYYVYKPTQVITKAPLVAARLE